MVALWRLRGDSHLDDCPADELDADADKELCPHGFLSMAGSICLLDAIVETNVFMCRGGA